MTVKELREICERMERNKRGNYNIKLCIKSEEEDVERDNLEIDRKREQLIINTRFIN